MSLVMESLQLGFVSRVIERVSRGHTDRICPRTLTSLERFSSWRRSGRAFQGLHLCLQITGMQYAGR